MAAMVQVNGRGGEGFDDDRILAAADAKGSGAFAIVFDVHCAMTGRDHRLHWMRSAWWCADCRQKIESCCEGGGCPSIAAVLAAAGAEHVTAESRAR